jgi:two-component system, OmpR family, phosphate regulon sensor histidine kinase PhoR
MEAALQRLRDQCGLSRKAFAECIVEEAVRLTGSTMAYFAVTDEEVRQLTMLAWSKSAMAACAVQELPIDYPIEATGLWGDCIRERQAVITNDYERCTRVTKKGYPDGHVAVRRHMNVAVMWGGQIKGILGVGNKTDEYTADDAAVLQSFANAAWPIFDHVQAGVAT